MVIQSPEFITTERASGIFRLILRVVTFLNRKKNLDKWWAIYNPYRMTIQTLIPQKISTSGNLYLHEIAGHQMQLMRTMVRYPKTGRLRFVLGIAVNVLLFGYPDSPLEIEARGKENV